MECFPRYTVVFVDKISLQYCKIDGNTRKVFPEGYNLL
jgi:hypothetical protein